MAKNLGAVILAVPTYRNASGLTKLLAHAADLEDRDLLAHILIVDNSPDAAAEATVEEVRQSGYPIPLRYVNERQAGIPFARNRMFHECEGLDYQYVAMLDDDEFPSPAWLTEMVKSATAANADIVGGPVAPVFEVPPQAPASQSPYFKSGGTRKRNGTQVVESTANIMLHRRVIEAFRGRWFSDAFAETGGSDVEFLRRTYSGGFKHAIAAKALVYEDIPKSRVSLEWQMKRAYRSANGRARARIMHYGVARAMVVEAANIVALWAVAAFYFAARRTNPEYEFGYLQKLNRIRGKIAAFRGRVYKEYGREAYRNGEG